MVSELSAEQRWPALPAPTQSFPEAGRFLPENALYTKLGLCAGSEAIGRVGSVSLGRLGHYTSKSMGRKLQMLLLQLEA